MIQNAKSPQWVNAEHTQLKIIVETEAGDELTLITGANNSVPEEKMLYNFAVNGLLGEIAEYIPPENIDDDENDDGIIV